VFKPFFRYARAKNGGISISVPKFDTSMFLSDVDLM